MASNKKLYKDAVSSFGHGPQIDVAVREASSLISEIQKYKLMRPHSTTQAIADMEIVCAQLRLIFQGVPEVKKKRLERLHALIQKRKELRKEN